MDIAPNVYCEHMVCAGRGQSTDWNMTTWISVAVVIIHYYWQVISPMSLKLKVKGEPNALLL